ncbi:MAG: hypothetical protein Fur0037_29010 [Planctomycetota bacterium]
MSDSREEFVSFEKALRDLKMRSEELKKLVSEGEIRAFRDGSSMKFRKEDIEALGRTADGEEELAFADSLEDDTGMVTEQISEEDTLIAEDEEEEEQQSTPSRRSGRSPIRAASSAAAQEKEPGWVTACAILGFLVAVWGFMFCYSISRDADPAQNFFTQAFARSTK